VQLLPRCAPHASVAPSHLRRYVDRREEVLPEVQRHYGCSRADAKRLFLSLGYGGAADTWLREQRASAAAADAHRVRMVGHLPFVLEFQEEVAAARHCLARHPDFKVMQIIEEQNAKHRRNGRPDKCRVGDEATRSGLALILQNEEDRLLAAMEAFFRGEGWTVGVLIFDGFLLRRREDRALTRELLDACQRDVQAQTGHEIRLEEKPLQP
jgi:hypothetical protein